MASILQFPGRGYSSSLTLGTTPEGQPIQVTQEELCSGSYVLGVQGMGKSSLFEHLIYQQMERDECIIVFDPKGGDLIRNVIARMCDFPHKLDRFVKHILATRLDQERFYRWLAWEGVQDIMATSSHCEAEAVQKFSFHFCESKKSFSPTFCLRYAAKRPLNAS